MPYIWISSLSVIEIREAENSRFHFVFPSYLRRRKYETNGEIAVLETFERCFVFRSYKFTLIYFPPYLIHVMEYEGNTEDQELTFQNSKRIRLALKRLVKQKTFIALEQAITYEERVVWTLRRIEEFICDLSELLWWWRSYHNSHNIRNRYWYQGIEDQFKASRIKRLPKKNSLKALNQNSKTTSNNVRKTYRRYRPHHNEHLPNRNSPDYSYC